MSETIVIIGAGQAGAQAAASLRQEGYAGAISLIGAEGAPPYQRPPLSKAYLQGALAEDRLWLRPFEFYEKNAIELRLGLRAEAIDRAGKAVLLAGGEAVLYDLLLLATGSAARRVAVPGAELAGVFALRTLADANALRPALAAARRLVVIGAGYIGLEIAAVARKAGLSVIAVEAEDRVLKRVASPAMSAHFERLHRSAGVEFRFGARLEGFEGEGAVRAARLSGGETLDCDVAVVGVGAAPQTALAEAAGLKAADGIVVDERARTDDPFIFAAGDAARHPSPLYGGLVRLESAPNAIDQAKVAAANMAGRDAVYDAVPWFWSDQYDVKLQTAGLSEGADETVLRGAPGDARFAVWRLRQGRVMAVEAAGDVAAFAVGKRLVAARAAPDRKTLADPAADLKSLLS